jgi:hypothetical protein
LNHILWILRIGRQLFTDWEKYPSFEKGVVKILKGEVHTMTAGEQQLVNASCTLVRFLDIQFYTENIRC